MRHRVAHRKSSGATEHRIALLRNQADALLAHERIETTVPKAKELRPFVERLITIAKRGVKAAEPKGQHPARAAWSCATSERGRRHQAVRHSSRRASWSGRVATPDPAARTPARRRRRDRPDRAGRQRVRSQEGRGREGEQEALKRGAEAEERRRALCAPPPRACAAARRRQGRRRAKQGEQAGQGRREEDHDAAKGRRVVGSGGGVHGGFGTLTRRFVQHAAAPCQNA